MNMTELKETLPNGLLDARLGSIGVDYLERTMTARIEVLVSSQEEEEETGEARYATGTLTVTGLGYFSLTPPEPSALGPTPEPLVVVDWSLDELEDRELLETLPRVPKGHFLHFFQSLDSGILILFMGQDARLELDEG